MYFPELFNIVDPSRRCWQESIVVLVKLAFNFLLIMNYTTSLYFFFLKYLFYPII